MEQRGQNPAGEHGHGNSVATQHADRSHSRSVHGAGRGRRRDVSEAHAPRSHFQGPKVHERKAVPFAKPSKAADMPHGANSGLIQANSARQDTIHSCKPSVTCAPKIIPQLSDPCLLSQNMQARTNVTPATFTHDSGFTHQ